LPLEQNVSDAARATHRSSRRSSSRATQISRASPPSPRSNPFSRTIASPPHARSASSPSFGVCNLLDDLRNSEGIPLLGLSGYGERRPVAPGLTEEAFAQNRRIDLRFVLSSRTSEDVRRLIEEIDAVRRVAP